MFTNRWQQQQVHLSIYYRSMRSVCINGDLYKALFCICFEMPCCCAPDCSNNRDGHRFPSDDSLKRQWIVAVRHQSWTFTKASVVCKNHFTADDYITATFYGLNTNVHYDPSNP